MMPGMDKLPLSDDPRQQAAQMAMVKVLSTPPEPILNLFERLSIPWERVTIDGESCCIIKWSDLMAGETRNQAEGPFIKKVVEEMREGFLATSPPTSSAPAPERHIERERVIQRARNKTKTVDPDGNPEPGKRPKKRTQGGAAAPKPERTYGDSTNNSHGE